MFSKGKLSVFIFFILILGFLYPQKRKHREIPLHKQPIYFETHIVPSDSLFRCFFSFKIPYANLLFIRDNNGFKSGVSITYEVFKKEEFISRIFDQKSVNIHDYELTKRNDLFLEGVISFKLKKGNYRVVPSLLLENTDIEITGNTFDLLVDSIQINRPIVISNESRCDNSKFKLVNFDNSVPFSSNSFSFSTQ